MLSWAILSSLRVRAQRLGQHLPDLGDGAGQGVVGGRGGLFQLAFAGAGAVEFGGEVGAILVDRRAGLLPRLGEPSGQPLLERGQRPVQPACRLIQGAVLTRVSRHRAPSAVRRIPYRPRRPIPPKRGWGRLALALERGEVDQSQSGLAGEGARSTALCAPCPS